MLSWYLVHTKPLSETIAQTHLERQGFEVYFPRLLQYMRRKQGLQSRINALFPRYLFLGLESGRQTLAPVRSTSGVANVVRFGSTFGIVPDAVIRELRSREDPDSGLHRLDGRTRFARGAAVTLASGAFDGLEGIFERPVGADRVVILLTLLGRTTPVQVPVDLVMPRQVA